MCSEPRRPPAGSGRGRGRWGAPAVALALLVALGAVACGKKGDPQPPMRFVPATTDQLTVQQRGLELILELPYPQVTAAGTALPGLDRVEVWEVVRVAADALTPRDEPPVTAAAEEGAPEAAAPEAAAPEPAPGEAAAEAAAPPAEGAAPVTGAEGEGLPPAAADAGAPALAPLDPQEHAAAATLRAAIEEPALGGFVVGDRLVITLPLATPFPAVAEARYLAVRTVVGEGDRSELSNQAVIVPRPPPPPPGGLTVEPRDEGIALAWQGDGPGVAGYHVYRRLAAERVWGPPLARVEAARTGHLDATAAFGQRYIYAVTAVAATAPVVESAIAETREVEYRDLFAPAPPAGLVALVEEGRVRLVWEAVRAADLAGYRILRRAGAGDFEPLGAGLITASERVDETVAPGVTYTWRVVAVDDDGNASPPAEVTASAR